MDDYSAEANLTIEAIKEAWEKACRPPEPVYLFLPEWAVLELYGPGYDEAVLKENRVIVVKRGL
jgi:hypothetical protein